MKTSKSVHSENTAPRIKYIPAGDAALIAKAGNDISELTGRRIQKMLSKIESKQLPGIIEMVPAFNELMIYFDCRLTDHEKLTAQLQQLEAVLQDEPMPERRLIRIPVLYGGRFGPDLPVIAAQKNLSEAEVIDIHTSREYPVYMLGFTPGFCYLGGVDSRIATPRHESPRTRVLEGSVGIAETQTGIYPITGPGGWQIIGRTPVRIFNPHRHPHFKIQAGDYIRFYAIDEAAFLEMKEAEIQSHDKTTLK